jgi:hypothetical protein
MAEVKLPWFPAVMERRGRVELLWAVYRDDITREWIVEDQYQGYPLVVSEMIEDTPKQVRFITDDGQETLLREAVPEDAARAITLSTTIPLPVEIIGAIMSDTTADPTISAAVADDGEVHTVILETGLGLYARYSRNWIRLADISAIDQLSIVAIPETDLEHYDQADEAGNTVNIRDLSPIVTTEDSVDTSLPPAEPAEPVTAGGRNISLVITSAADLPTAIEYAATPAGEASRWYVARRARALGWKEALPWE